MCGEKITENTCPLSAGGLLFCKWIGVFIIVLGNLLFGWSEDSGCMEASLVDDRLSSFASRERKDCAGDWTDGLDVLLGLLLGRTCC
ncbi:hypothetical protein Ancab_007873 [Ancistrocladus abbreviatus]